MITQAICHILLYYEEFQQIEDAIAREKELKGWSRSKKDTLIKEKNGKSIAVYQPQKKDVVEQLLLDNRVNYVCKSDFKSNSTLEKLVKLILDSISISEKLLSKENSQYIS